ncbi:MAG: oligoendopeptidase F, partial [Candidatus Thermofonsia Clade 3 bacterium]
EQLSLTRQFHGRLAESPDTLADWLEHYQALMADTQRVVMYAQLDYSVDTNDQTAAERVAKATSLASMVQAAVAFAEPELMSIGFETLRRWQTTHPRLKIYAHYFDNLERMSAHVRSAEVEELLGLVEDPFRTAASTHGVLTNSELVFAPAHSSDGEHAFEVTHGTITALLSHPDREVRRTAWESYADGHLAFQKT